MQLIPNYITVVPFNVNVPMVYIQNLLPNTGVL